MSSFEEQLQSEIKAAILTQVRDTRYVQHSHGLRPVPNDVVDKVWDAIDWDEVVAQIIGTVQTRICAVVTDSMMTEIKTDTKKILAIEGVRERLRAQAYPKIMQAIESA